MKAMLHIFVIAVIYSTTHVIVLIFTVLWMEGGDYNCYVIHVPSIMEGINVFTVMILMSTTINNYKKEETHHRNKKKIHHSNNNNLWCLKSQLG
jgi:hypothetical protein